MEHTSPPSPLGRGRGRWKISVAGAIALSGLLCTLAAFPGSSKEGSDGPALPPVLVTRRGEYVTGLTDATDEDLAWMARFDVVHVGGLADPLSPTLMAELRAAGVRTILAYEWMPAGYHYTDGSGDDPLMTWAYTHRPTATLNPDGPFPHCTESGYDWCEDYYYDLGNPEVVSRRVGYLLEEAKRLGYDGLFFDWASGRFIYEPDYGPISRTYRSRHPDRPYVQAVADFYAALRNAAPDLIVQTNQGFREAERLLPLVEYDMAESYITDYDYFSRTLYVQGRGMITVPQTIYYPLSDDPSNGHLTDTLDYLDYLTAIDDAHAGPRFRGTVYMNYVAPDYVTTGQTISGYEVYTATVPRNAIYFAYAVSKLASQIAYTEVPVDHRLERDQVYFFDLGSPLGETYERAADGYVRFYNLGLVLVGEWQSETEVTLHSPYIPPNVPVYDAFERTWLTTGPGVLTVTVRPRPDPLTGRMAPSGRVYLYGLTRRLFLPLSMRGR